VTGKPRYCDIGAHVRQNRNQTPDRRYAGNKTNLWGFFKTPRCAADVSVSEHAKCPQAGYYRLNGPSKPVSA